MKVVGFVTEYNPFHQGHQYHIEESKRLTGADFTIAVMSGDYVQRGTPALLPKHTRAKMALLHGVDLVLELPVPYATASAETFAFGAVSLLDQLGVVDSLSFGSEWGKIDPFLSLASILEEEPRPYREKLKTELAKGSAFPKARATALLACQEALPDSFPLTAAEFSSFLASPNNILGLEYCKALRKRHSRIVPYTLPRKGCGHHNTALEEYASATGIRKELSGTPDWIILSVVLPREIYGILQEEYGKTLPIEEDDFSLLLRYQFMQKSWEDLTRYEDLSKELARRIKNHENEFRTFSQFADLLKTKEMTHTRIKRALLHLLLGIQEAPPISYARILGMRKSAAPLLSALKTNSQIPLLSKLSDGEKLLCAEGKKLLEKEVFASNLYEMVLSDKYSREFVHEYQKPIVVL